MKMKHKENVKIIYKGEPDEYGVYDADIEINGIRKRYGSTFFPKDWTPQEIIDFINIAYTNKKQIGNTNKYKAIVNGIEIQMYLNDDKKIMTVFPKKSKIL